LSSLKPKIKPNLFTSPKSIEVPRSKVQNWEKKDEVDFEQGPKTKPKYYLEDWVEKRAKYTDRILFRAKE